MTANAYASRTSGRRSPSLPALLVGPAPVALLVSGAKPPLICIFTPHHSPGRKYTASGSAATAIGRCTKASGRARAENSSGSAGRRRPRITGCSTAYSERVGLQGNVARNDEWEDVERVHNERIGETGRAIDAEGEQRNDRRRLEHTDRSRPGRKDHCEVD